MSEYTYLRAEKNASKQPEAYVKVTSTGAPEEIAYPSGERAKGYAAAILWKSDLKPVCSFTKVDVSKTPFEGDYNA